MLLLAVHSPYVGVYVGGKLRLINSDLRRLAGQVAIDLPLWLLLLYQLHSNSYYRSLFYHRIGAVRALLIGWYRPGNPYFILPKETVLGEGVLMAHPYGTVLNAERIGTGFTFMHHTTLGKKNGHRPVIGNNVQVGCGATILGGVTIGDNVVIGAESLVLHDVPANCIVAGNPARIIRELKEEEHFYLHGSEARQHET